MGRTRTAAARRAPAPTINRRVSGPIRPGHPRPVAVPQRVTVPAAPAGARLRALPDHRFLDTLLRSRAWIWLIGIALGGIVFMQVSLLKLNAGIGRAVEATTALEHTNATLEKQVAELSSGERIREAAGAVGLLVPEAGSVGYLTVRPGVDARRAAQNMTAPSEAARRLLASGGVVATEPVVDPATTTTTTTATATEPAPTATSAPVATPVATATPAPVATQTEPAPVGAAAAPIQ